MPQASETGEHKLRLVKRDVVLLEGESGGPPAGPPLERRPVLLGGQDHELGRVDQQICGRSRASMAASRNPRTYVRIHQRVSTWGVEF
jgi:hypothetical protein